MITNDQKKGTPMTKIETRALTDLTIHPFLQDSPMLSSLHPDFRNLVAAMESEGLDEHPIIINPANQIMDGRHRAAAARFLNWTEIPVLVRPDDRAEEIIVHAVTARRHMLKWQMAYSLNGIYERYVEKGIAKRSLNLKVGKNRQISPNGASCADRDGTLLAGMLGIAEDTWKRVREVRARFAKKPELQRLYEPRMFLPESDPNAISLEGVMKALGAIDSYATNAPDLKAKRGEYDRLALESIRKASAQLDFWDKLGDPQKEKLADEAAKVVLLWPIQMKKELLKALQSDLKHHSVK